MQVSPLEVEMMAQRQSGAIIQMIGEDLVNTQLNRRILKLNGI